VLSGRKIIVTLCSSAFLAFGLYHVHSVSQVTEGGVLGMTLLLQYWLHLSPAVSGFLMNLFCYLFSWRILGKRFILYSMIANVGFSVSYRIFEQFDPLWPELYHHPLIAAVVGAFFVGAGVGFCVRMGGAPSGDDAMAMGFSHRFGVKIETVYLISDCSVFLLSLSYIPLQKIIYSLITAILSGQLIGLIQRIPKKADG